MAIILVSSKKKKKMFLTIVILSLIFVLFIISLIIFPPSFGGEPKMISREKIIRPDITINFNVLDSEQVSGLETFVDIKTEFAYTAEDKDGTKVQGSLQSLNKNEVKATLEQSGLKVLTVQEVLLGKNEPFAPYY